VLLFTAQGAHSHRQVVYGVAMTTGRAGSLRQAAADEPRLNATGTELAARTWFTRLAVTAATGRTTTLQVPVAAGIGPTPPFWSPDGRYIALLSGFPASPSEAEPPADLLTVLVPSTGRFVTVVANHRALGLVRWMQWTPADQLLFSAGGRLYGVTRPTASNTVNYMPMALATGPMGDGGRFSVAPTGALVAWIRAGHVWVGGLGGRPAPHALTAGAATDADPVFSPDGRYVAFLVTGGAGVGRVWIVPAAGGAARPLTVARPVPRGLALDGAVPIDVTEVDEWYGGGNDAHWLQFGPPPPP
jgi:dipeptidyl aminopeptidase/acylaminoacyl peptidase